MSRKRLFIILNRMLRYEYKYFVPCNMLEKLRNLVAPFMALDKHALAHGGEYTVRSIYFDTNDFECYRYKIEGVKRRNKVRLRGYNGGNLDSKVFFEIKKKVDEPLFKNRASMTFEAAQRIISGEPVEEFVISSDRNPRELEDARRFMYHLHARRMKPVVTVIYEREPYVAKFDDKENNFRITFDKNLRAVAFPSLDDLFEEKHPYIVNENFFILEVKFNVYMPSWIKSVVAALDLKKESASKYVLSLEAHPSIPVSHIQ